MEQGEDRARELDRPHASGDAPKRALQQKAGTRTATGREVRARLDPPGGRAPTRGDEPPTPTQGSGAPFGGRTPFGSRRPFGSGQSDEESRPFGKPLGTRWLQGTPCPPYDRKG